MWSQSTIRRSQDNEAARAGGGIENNAGIVTLTGNHTVGGAVIADDGNTAGVNGGGLHASGAASVTTVNGGTVQNNIAGQEGGGLWVADGLLTIDGTTITENIANSGNNANNDQGGGGVFNIGGTLDIDNAIITKQPRHGQQWQWRRCDDRGRNRHDRQHHDRKQRRGASRRWC